ncbi:hypothetical protein GCM10028794_04700 [Silanimonas algicola]
MAFPDVLTIVAIAAGSNLLVGGFMVLMHRSKPNSGYFPLLAIGAIAAALGWGLYATRLLDWSPWASFVAANALITLYPALLVLALRRHLGRRRHPHWTRAVALAFAVFLVLLALGQDASRSTRIFVVSGGNALFFLASLAVLLKHGRPWDMARGVITATVGITACIFTLRMGAVVALGPEDAAQEMLIGLALVVPVFASFVLGLAFPVAEFARDERRMADLSERDPLTRLPNRRFALRALKQRVTTTPPRPFAVVFVDLDGFKRVNDSLGHAVGDDLLVQISQRLLPGMGDHELLARLGGDEFLLVFDLEGQALPIEARVQRLLDRLGPPFRLGDREIHIGASAGICLFPDEASSVKELIRHADAAMYRAKDAGRGRACRYTPDLGLTLMAEMELEAQLRDAIRSDRLVVDYQPRIALSTRRIHGAEALVRLALEDGTTVAPDRFIALAERTGLIVPLGRAVLQRACDDAARWWASGHRPRVSVNLSPVQLRDPRLLDDVRDALHTSGLPAAALELELTETALIEDPALVAERMHALRALGATLALDDFGMGYSSLAHLLRFPIDVIKIDRHFISRMATDADASALVVTLMDLGRRLGMAVVAEGVERPDVLEALTRLGCREAQGLLLHAPMSAGAFAVLLEREALAPAG